MLFLLIVIFVHYTEKKYNVKVKKIIVTIIAIIVI